jgi:PAS domain S-box-containing protein
MEDMEGYSWVLSSLVVALSVDRAVLFQYSEGYTGGTFIAVSGKPLPSLDVEVVWGEGHIPNDEFWSVEDVLLDPKPRRLLDGLGARSYLYSTINVGGILWGAIGIHMLDMPRTWTEDDRILLYSSMLDVGRRVLRTTLTENIALHSRIKKSKLLLQRVIDSSPIYLGIKDGSGKFVLVNKTLSEAAGYDHPRDMIGQAEWGDYFPPESINEENRVLGNGEAVANLSSKGRDRWFTTMRAYIPGDRHLQPMVVSTLVDITDLTVITRRLEDFMHIASHDLQEPLRTISSFLGLLKKRHGGDLSGTALSYVDTAIDASRRMGDLLSDLLAYSRLGAKAKPFAMVPLSNAIMKALKNISGKLMMEVCPTIMYDPSAFPNVWGDEVQLIACLQNLLSNAIKFGGGSPVEIACNTSPTHWEITITDYGIGIPEGMEEAVFAPFKRAHSAYEGTGMGLAIVRKVAHMHQGDAWATGTLGGGTTMHVTIKRP